MKGEDFDHSCGATSMSIGFFTRQMWIEEGEWASVGVVSYACYAKKDGLKPSPAVWAKYPAPLDCLGSSL